MVIRRPVAVFKEMFEKALPFLCTLGFIAAAVVAPSCSDGGKVARVSIEDRSKFDFGAEAFKIIRSETAKSADKPVKKVEVLDRRQAEIVEALNTLFPDTKARGFLKRVENLFTLIDDGTIPKMTRDLARVVGMLLADDKTIDAITTLSNTTARIERGKVVDLFESLVKYDALESALSALAKVIRNNDGVDESGAPNGESDIVGDWLSFFSDKLTGLEDDATGQTPFQDFLIRLLAEDLSIDPFGVGVTANRIDAGGAITGTFNPKQTPASLILQNVRALLEKEVLTTGVTGQETALGPRVSKTDSQGSYASFDDRLKDNPVIDLLWGFLELFKLPAFRPALETLAIYARQHEPELRDLLTQVGRVIAISRETAVSAKEKNTLFDTLLPFLDDFCEPTPSGRTILRELMRKASDARLSGLSQALATNYRYKDRDLTKTNRPNPIPDPTLPPAVEPAIPFNELTDFSQPRSAANRSAHHGMLKLLHETNGAPYRVTLLGVGLTTVTNNMAVFYLESMAGNANLNTINALLAGFLGLPATPSARDMNDFVNTNQPISGNPTLLDGVTPIMGNGGEYLYDMEYSGLLDKLTPVAEVFSGLGKTQRLVDLFSELYRHYAPTAQAEMGGKNSYGSDIAAVEEMTWKIMQQTTFVDALLLLLRRLDGITLADGSNGGDAFTAFLGDLFNDDAPLTLRDGATSTVMEADRVTVAPGMARLHWILEPSRRINERIKADARAREADDKVFKAVNDIFFEVQQSQGTATLKNAVIVPTLKTVLPVLVDEIKLRQGKSTWTGDMQWTQDKIAEFYAGRDAPRVFDWIKLVRDDPASDREFRNFLLFLLKPESDALKDAYGRALVVLSEAVQIKVDTNAVRQVGRFVGRVIRPSDRVVVDLVDGVEKVLTLDNGKEVLRLLRATFTRGAATNKAPITVLLDVSEDIDRVTGSGSYTRQDWIEIFTDLRDSLLDDVDGVEHFYDVIKKRNR
ncbi:MAG: hypothetical protein HY719_07380 [Planctomycetes bacterium]|nr:hypothetical protein [Planctomycetota bacterium]